MACSSLINRNPHGTKSWQRVVASTLKQRRIGKLIDRVRSGIKPVRLITPTGAVQAVQVPFEADVINGALRRSTLMEFIAATREAASQIMTNLGNAVDLIQSFKQVAADRNVSDRRRFDLGEVTEQVVRGLQFGLRGKNLTVSVECEPDLAMNSYPGPYGQVLTNLVLNASVHAFPEGAGGSVHIAAQASGRDKVEVLFSDDGCGMSPEVRRQVFDPFFTTRRDQGSTGLGLHIVHNIVTNRLGGRINLETKPGAGTKIRIIVPRDAPLEFAAE